MDIEPAPPQIIGVCLIRNEEHFVAWSIMNAIEYCDRILVLDNRSTDRTRSIVEAISGLHSHVEIVDVDDAYDTHRHIEPFVGTRTWVSAIDGDEIYDPIGLSRLRRQIHKGELDSYWALYPHALHLMKANLTEARASGYATPDAKFGMRCFNLDAMVRWHPGRHERLHGLKSIILKPGYSRQDVFMASEHDSWDEASYRCLHLCFMPRSSLDQRTDTNVELSGRHNPSQEMKSGSPWRKLRNAVMKRLDPGHAMKTNYKYKHYAKGPVREFDIAAFGTPADHHAVDPECEVAVDAIEHAAYRG